MTLYEKYAGAWEARDIEMLAAQCHPNLEMVMHSSGSVISKTEYIIRLEPLIKNYSPENLRCLYENENVLIMHFIMPFPNGSKDAVLYYIEKKDGLIRKIEADSTSIRLRRNK